MMLNRVLQYTFLLLIAIVPFTAAQSQSASPVTKGEVKRSLEGTEDIQVAIDQTNQELIAAIKKRGVNFILSPEEEWSFKLRDASDELIKTIRDAVNPAERERELKAAKQSSLYYAFINNYKLNDLASKRTAYDAANEFIGLYARDTAVAQAVDLMRRQLPGLQGAISALERREQIMDQARIRNEALRVEQANRRAAAAAAAAARAAQSNAEAPAAPTTSSPNSTTKKP